MRSFIIGLLFGLSTALVILGMSDESGPSIGEPDLRVVCPSSGDDPEGPAIAEGRIVL